MGEVKVWGRIRIIYSRGFLPERTFFTHSCRYLRWLDTFVVYLSKKYQLFKWLIVVPLLGMSKVRFIVVNLFSNTLLELHEILLLQMHKMTYKLIQKITYLFVCHYLFLFKSLSFIISCFNEWWIHLNFHCTILMQSSVKCSRNIDYLLIAFFKNNLVVKSFS